MKEPGPRFAILEDVSPPESRSTRRRLTTFGIAALVTISGLATALLLFSVRSATTFVETTCMRRASRASSCRRRPSIR